MKIRLDKPTVVSLDDIDMDKTLGANPHFMESFECEQLPLDLYNWSFSSSDEFLMRFESRNHKYFQIDGTGVKCWDDNQIEGEEAGSLSSPYLTLSSNLYYFDRELGFNCPVWTTQLTLTPESKEEDSLVRSRKFCVHPLKWEYIIQFVREPQIDTGDQSIEFGMIYRV